MHQSSMSSQFKGFEAGHAVASSHSHKSRRSKWSGMAHVLVMSPHPLDLHQYGAWYDPCSDQRSAVSAQTLCSDAITSSANAIAAGKRLSICFTMATTIT